jgi:hypothetical protein
VTHRFAEVDPFAQLDGVVLQPLAANVGRRRQHPAPFVEDVSAAASGLLPSQLVDEPSLFRSNVRGGRC